MEIGINIDPSARLVTYALDHLPTPDETRGFFDALLSHPAYGPGYAVLGDCRRLRADPDAASIRAFAREVRNRANELEPCKWAILSTTACGFAAVRLVSVLTYGSWVEFAPFLTPAEAEGWLGVGSPAVRNVVLDS